MYIKNYLNIFLLLFVSLLLSFQVLAQRPSINSLQTQIDTLKVLTPISSLPYTISEPGSYYLTKNLNASAPNGSQLGQIDVNSDNVTIDLMGFTLDGDNVDDYGIEITDRSNVVIRNGTVRNFGRAGIYALTITGTSNVIQDLQVSGNGSLGSSSIYSGIFLFSVSSRIERVNAAGNGGIGLLVGENGVIKDSVAEGSGGTYGIYGSKGAKLIGNHVHLNQQYGIWAQDSNFVGGNTVHSNNQARSVNGGGIYVNGISYVFNNNVSDNYGVGIYSLSGNTLRDNFVGGINNTAGSVNCCIYFASGNNAATGNTTRGCTGFGGSIPPASRFVDNYEW